MPRFDDYHRTVIGYHGTGLSAALRVVNRVEEFRPSERDYDWLGRGVYFWEYAPKQALRFAELRQRQLRKKRNRTPEEERRASERLAVVGCMIRLGHCLDLTEPDHIKYVRDVYADYAKLMADADAKLPQNTRKYRKLDCAVFEYAYRLLEGSDPTVKVDTARGGVRPDRRRQTGVGRELDLPRHPPSTLRPQPVEPTRRVAAPPGTTGDR